MYINSTLTNWRFLGVGNTTGTSQYDELHVIDCTCMDSRPNLTVTM